MKRFIGAEVRQATFPSRFNAFFFELNGILLFHMDLNDEIKINVFCRCFT